jgi:hypothetical protein
MDPVSAFGLAANILQFIELGYNLASTIYQLSKHGELAKYKEATFISEDLNKICKDTKVRGYTTDELALQQLGMACERKIEHLDSILQRLKGQSGDGTFKLLQKAVQTMIKEKEIIMLEGDLDRLKSQIIMHVLQMLRSVDPSPRDVAG